MRSPMRPVLFARLNTVGQFSDIPLLSVLRASACRRRGYAAVHRHFLERGWRHFDTGSNGTVGANYRYRVRVPTICEVRNCDRARAGSRRHGVQGRMTAIIRLLMPVTDNNMIAARQGFAASISSCAISWICRRSSREQIMDRNPITYEVMIKELDREAKLRPFGVVDGEKVSDPRNYLFVDYAAKLTHAALTVAVRLDDGKRVRLGFRTRRYCHPRDGYVRTTVELPPETPASRVKEMILECRVSPPPKGAPWPHSGTCEIQAVTKVFLLQRDYTPGPSLWSTDKAVTLSTGRGISFTP